MKSIPKATAIELTQDDRTVLEGFVRFTKTEYSLLERARIVFLAAGGMATRPIDREVGCTTGTASKWKVRFAKHRLEGLSETGNRGGLRPNAPLKPTSVFWPSLILCRRMGMGAGAGR